MSEQGVAQADGDEGRRPRSPWLRAISGTVVTVLVIVAGVFAFRADGKPVHDVELTDSGIWVSGGRSGNWGRVNTGAHALDLVIGGAGATGPTPRYVARPDILQDGRNVIGVSGVDDSRTKPRTLVSINPTTGEVVKGKTQLPPTQLAFGDSFTMPDLVALNGNTLAFVDHASGNLYAKRLSPRGGDSIDGLFENGPLTTVGPGAAVTVSNSGDVMAVSAESGTVVEVPAKGTKFDTPERTDLSLPGESRVADITAVGDTWVVLDLEDGMIYAKGLDQPKQLPGGGSERGQALAQATLQQAGPQSSRVAVQAVGRAEYVEIEDGAADSADLGIDSGLEDNDRQQYIKLSRPVMNGDCLYAAWGSGNTVLWGRTCGKTSEQVSTLPVVSDVERLSGVVVRYNRGKVLLNDLDTGRIFDLSLSTDSRIDTWPQGAGRAEPTPYTPDHQKSAPPTKKTTPQATPKPKPTKPSKSKSR